MRKGLLILTTFFVISCQSGISWNPDFFVHNSDLNAIISERGDIVSCSDEGFNDFASMHKEKIKELAEILRRARLPKELEETRKRIIKEIKRIEGGANFAP